MVPQIFFWSALAYWIAGFSELSDVSDSSDTPDFTQHPPELSTTGDLSVVIPARNEADNIGILLDSLLAQRSRPREILVVDDQSEDGTGEMASGGEYC
jgi:cellulose synthase/poly-beta-1,6-N-acetylglucosamine synthase-like glycosyltransferase